jgi:glycosyltransferase involved in cell wall biosynthesis
MFPQRTPLVTIGIVALNRAWIIDHALSSLLSQTYPHTGLFVLFVDGGSKDGTAELAKEILRKSDLNGYEVVVQRCTIPEGRNICLERMRGDLLLFWDSDIIMPSDAVAKLVEAYQNENADLITADVKQITVSSTDEIEQKLKEAGKLEQPTPCVEINAATMGQSLLSKKLATSISFDPDLTNNEDSDFCLRAKAKGFRIMLCRNVVVLDVNIYKIGYSDLHIDTPLKYALRGIRKKSKAQVYAYSFESEGWRGFTQFFSQHKRYLFYLIYIPTFIITIIGVILGNIFLSLTFPVYLLLYLVLQIRRRGLTKGLKALVRSLVVGIPNSLWITYYCFEATMRSK